MIGALKKSEADGVLDSGEFGFVPQHRREFGPWGSTAAVRDLTRKLIDGDPANATFQSTAVGNLAPGSPSWKVDDLERKWFEGQDRPNQNFIRTNSDGTQTTVNGGAYSKATGALFGAGGPVYSDIYQGNVGDCYFLASPGGDGLPEPLDDPRACSPTTGTGPTRSDSSTASRPNT